MIQKPLSAREIMDPEPATCGPETPLAEVAKRFAEEGITGLLVVDEQGRLIGVITESDLIDQQKSLHLPTVLALFDAVIPIGEARFEQELARMQAMTAADLMRRDVVTVGPEAELGEIASIMDEHGVHHLPVLDEGRLIGLVSRREIVRALAGKRR